MNTTTENKTNKNNHSYIKIFCFTGIIFLGLLLMWLIFSPTLGVFIANNFDLGAINIGISIIPLAFDHISIFWITVISAFLIITLPLTWITISIIKRLSNEFKVNRKITRVMFVVFIISIISLTFTLGITASNFIDLKRIGVKTEIKTSADSLIIHRITDLNGKEINGFTKFKNGDYATILSFDFNREGLDFRIKPTNDSIPYLITTLQARGRFYDALTNIKTIDYKPHIIGNNIYLSNFLVFKRGTKWRDQYVYVTLYLPKDKSVTFRNLPLFAFENEGDSQLYGRRTIDKDIFKFKNGNLECLNCNGNDYYIEKHNKTEKLEFLNLKIKQHEQSIGESKRNKDARK